MIWARIKASLSGNLIGANTDDLTFRALTMGSATIEGIMEEKKVSFKNLNFFDFETISRNQNAWLPELSS